MTAADLPVEQPMKFRIYHQSKSGQADRLEDSTESVGEGGSGHPIGVSREAKGVRRERRNRRPLGLRSTQRFWPFARSALLTWRFRLGSEVRTEASEEFKRE